MKRLAYTLLYIILLAAGASAQESTKAERNFVVEGNALFNEGNYHAALEKYEAALATNPNYQYALYDKAVTLTKLASDDNKGTENDPRKIAQQIFASIAELNTNHDLAANSLYNLGNMAFNDNDFGSAIDFYKGSLRIRPNDRKCRQNLLIALQKQEEQEQNQDQNQDQDQDEQEQEQEQPQPQPDQQDQQEQQQEQQQMTQPSEQILQTVQNKENATRRRTDARPDDPAEASRRTTDKPW